MLQHMAAAIFLLNSISFCTIYTRSIRQTLNLRHKWDAFVASVSPVISRNILLRNKEQEMKNAAFVICE